MKSVFGKLNRKDLKRSLGVAFGTSVTYLFGQMVWGIVPDMEVLKSVASVFGGTMGTYLFKNLFTNSCDETFRGEHECNTSTNNEI
jgi:hypothetical protein